MSAPSKMKESVEGKSEKPSTGRSERWTTVEILTLINYVKEKGGVLFGSGGGHGVEGRKRKAWTEVAERVAEVGKRVDRGGLEGARKKWQDLTHRAKKYLRDRNGKNVTDGGPQPPTNEIFEAVLEVLPAVVTQGVAAAGVCETGPPCAVKQGVTAAGMHKTGTSSEVAKTIKEVIPVSSDTPGVSGVGQQHQESTTSETESSQDQSQDLQPLKRKKTQKTTTKGKGKIIKREKTQKSTDVSLLELNMKIAEQEDKKLMFKKEKIKLQREMVEVLKKINSNIEKLIPPISPIDIGILNSMQAEQ